MLVFQAKTVNTIELQNENLFYKQMDLKSFSLSSRTLIKPVKRSETLSSTDGIKYENKEGRIHSMLIKPCRFSGGQTTLVLCQKQKNKKTNNNIMLLITLFSFLNTFSFYKINTDCHTRRVFINLAMIESQRFRWAFNSIRFSYVKWQDTGIAPASDIKNGQIPQTRI